MLKLIQYGVNNSLVWGVCMASRVRCFSLITYLSQNEIEEVIQAHTQHIKAYAYIYHDMDLTDEGHFKQAHYHILIATYNAYTLDTVRNWFLGFKDSNNLDINTFCERVLDKSQAYLYLTHETEKAIRDGKYKYSKEDIHSCNSTYFLDNSVSDDCILLALQEMLDGVLLCEIAKKYGRDFILHYGHIKTLFNDIQNQTGGKML